MIKKIPRWLTAFSILIGITSFYSCCSFASGSFIQIKGSDTEVNLVQRLAEVYMEHHPEVYIAVTGGGSGTGIAALINKKTDIANLSREMTPEEIKRAIKNGVNPVKWVIAMDGISVIVNAKNPVNKLTLKQISQIFSGKIKNWREVGGENIPISLYGRQSNSGTFIYFRNHIVKADYSDRMKRMNGNAQIVESIKRDVAGIGYVGVGYVLEGEKLAKGIKVLKIAKDEHSPGVSPLNFENVEKGVYPIARPLYQYSNGCPKGKVLEFVRFELSKEGQKIVIEQGFYPVNAEYRKLNRQNLGF